MTGIPGVGKTTVLNELQDLAKQNRFSLTVVNFGTVMNGIMRELGKNLHRDDMRQQSIETQKKAQELAASEIVTHSTEGTTIVDTHMFVRTGSGLWAGLPQNVLQSLSPRLLVLVEADPEQIAVRRRTDTDRRREQVLAEDIKFDLEWSRATAAASYKPATMENGLVVSVPPFVQEGDVIRIDTREDKYLERVQ
ncbi:MAG: AAA family ATPase [Candidatus Aminicenantales bacterium]